MADKEAVNKKTIAYTITAGYYPEIATKVKFGGMQKGNKGADYAKYFEKRGFSESSIRRVKREVKQQLADDPNRKRSDREKRMGRRYVPEAFYSTDKAGRRREGKAVLERPSGQEHLGTYLGFGPGGGPQQLRALGFGEGKAISREEFGKNNELLEAAGEAEERAQLLTYDKWMGGSELHKLYGTKVWYQEGIRDRKSLTEALVEWGNAIEGGNSEGLPKNFLNNIYSRMEPRLVKVAANFARKLFDGALDNAMLAEKLETVGSDVDVPEEDTAEAQKKMKKGFARQSKEGNIKIDARSMAQKTDILTKTAEGEDLYLDSTEVGLTQDAGHGVLAGADDPLMKAISTAIMDVGPDSDKTQHLRVLIQDFFISNIKNDYNPAIRELTDFAAKTLGKNSKKDVINFKEMLDAIDEHRKQTKDKLGKLPKNLEQKTTTDEQGNIVMQTSVKNIASAMGTVLTKDVTKPEHRDINAWKYIIHMLANLGDGTRRNFRQGHRLATYPDNTRLYASVPMGFVGTSRGMQFVISGPRSPMGTTIIKGESHLLALAVANRGIRASKTAEVNQRQTQARANVLIVGAANGGHRRINFESKDIIKRKCHPTTVVTFSPTGLKTMFEQVMGTFQKGRWGASPEEKGVQEEWAKSADSLLKKKMYSWPDKPFRKNAKRGGAKGRDQKFRKSSILDGAKFWALPYVGINDNIYRGKGHMQQE